MNTEQFKQTAEKPDVPKLLEPPLSDAAIHKELDLIQDIIKRMAANSFQIKAWMTGVVTAVLAFKHEEIFSGSGCSHNGVWMACILLVPVAGFWYLDAFYVKTEQKYRKLYFWVVNNRPYTKKYQYDLHTFVRESFNSSSITAPVDISEDEKETKGKHNGHSMTTRSVLGFYFVALIIVAGLILYNLTTQIF